VNQKLDSKNRDFRVATIIYSEKLWKIQKHKVWSMKPDFGCKSRLHVAKLLAPYNARPKTIPLIKCVKIYAIFKIFNFLQKIITIVQK